MSKSSNNFKLNFDISNMYSVNDVKNGFHYWLSKLLQITLGIFDYKNLPDSLPQREIELQLQLYGHCVIFEKNGELVTSHTTLNGVGKYYNPLNGVYTQPVLGSGNLDIDGFNNVIVYNTLIEDNLNGIYFDNTLITFCARYARLLADTESSYNLECVNLRKKSIPVAKDDSVKASVQRFLNKITLGYFDIISDTQVISSFDNKINNTNTNNLITELLFARDKILEQFYRDVGIKFMNPKKAQLNADEVESDTQVLLVNLDGMLAERKKGVDKLNEKFNLNVSVELNDKFKRENFVENYSMDD